MLFIKAVAVYFCHCSAEHESLDSIGSIDDLPSKDQPPLPKVESHESDEEKTKNCSSCEVQPALVYCKTCDMKYCGDHSKVCIQY